MSGHHGQWTERHYLDEPLTGVDPATTQLDVADHLAIQVGHEAGHHVPRRDKGVDQVRHTISAEGRAVHTTNRLAVLGP
jgi:hypothetical protein